MLEKTLTSSKLLANCCFIGVIFAGCSTPQSPAPVITKSALPQTAVLNPQTVPPDAEADLASYTFKLKTLSPQVLQLELIRLRQHARDAPNYANRLRLALALWVSGGDDTEIQALADSGSAGAADTQMRGIGLLLASISSERRRNRELQASSQSRNQEAKRSQESQQARLDALQRQIDELERKLAALRDMEKSLIQRP